MERGGARHIHPTSAECHGLCGEAMPSEGTSLPAAEPPAFCRGPSFSGGGGGGDVSTSAVVCHVVFFSRDWEHLRTLNSSALRASVLSVFPETP